MILPALIKHYDTLVESGADIAQYGFSRQKISFCVHLDSKGALLGIRDMREESDRGGKLVARTVIVPGQSKPSGQGINPCFLWDNSAYMLGWKADDPKPERTRQSFEAFRDHHLALRETIDDEAFHAVCAFLRAWDPQSFDPDEETREALNAFGVFRVGDEHAYVHQRKRVRDWYLKTLERDEQDEAPLVPSLTTGVPARIARLHEPKIKGVRDAQSSGAALVSFNESAFESYGKSQGANAPVSETDAFKYCTVLNRLLADSERRTTIGDATVVWWADAPESDGMDLLSALFSGRTIDNNEETSLADAEDSETASWLRSATRDIARSVPPRELKDSNIGFHVLGLSPNAARLSVRFWWDGTLGEMVNRLVEHQQDAHLEPIPERERGRPLTIYRMVSATARAHGDRPDMDTVSPTLAGEITRAVLTGAPYPMSLLEAVIRRVRADGKINHLRASVVKACIARRRRVFAAHHSSTLEVPVTLNLEGPTAYQLGRLFAVLDKTQADALGSVNAPICDRYFGSASATPASVFPRLLRLNRHHVAKLDGGRRINREKLLQEVCSRIDRFPRHLALEDQGLFQIGFYHQQQDFYTKKNDTPASEEN